MRLKFFFRIFLFIFLAYVFVGQKSQTNRKIASLSHYYDIKEVAESNRALFKWYEQKSSNLIDWLSKRGTPNGPPDYIDFYIPGRSYQLNPTAIDIQISLETKHLFDQYFPTNDPASYVGTFFESGHPYIETRKGPYQWNSMQASNMDQPENFRKAVSALRRTGLKAIRLGPNIHEVEIGNLSSWDSFIKQLEIIWLEGGTPTISVAFFPSLKKWEVKDSSGQVDYQRSYLLNENWPRDMGRLTQDLMKRVWGKAKELEIQKNKTMNVVINGINEPETLAGFNRHFWHGAFANWGDPQTMRYYIPSIIQIAKANVEIRKAVESSRTDKRVLFMHNEAMTPEYYPSHRGEGRFAVSKFMLGDEDLLNTDFDLLSQLDLEDLKQHLHNTNLNEVKWALREYIFGSWNASHESQIKARNEILKQFSELKQMHLEFQRKFSKTMKTDMMLHLDYYYQTEFIPNKSVPSLVEELSTDRGEGLKKLLGFNDDQSFFNYLKKTAHENKYDLPPEGPKGAILKFPYQNLNEIDFRKLLSQEDYVLLERIVGLRREIFLVDEEPFLTRQKKAGLRSSSEPLYRSDSIFQNVLLDYQKIFNVKTSGEFKKLLLESGRILGLNFDPKESVKDILDSNGRTLLHHLLGIKRNFLLGFEPPHYPRQVRAGIRYGFYEIYMQYIKALKIYTVGVGESGTPFYVFAPLLHDQMMMEYARALQNGLYGTQYSFGPAVNTRGWAKAPLGLHYEDDHEINPSGILSNNPDEKSHSSWAPQFLNPLFESLKQN